MELKLLLRLLAYTRPYLWRVLACVVVVLLTAAKPIALAWTVKAMIDACLLADPSDFIRFSLVAASIAIGGALFGALQAYLSDSLSLRATNDLKNSLFDHIHRLPMRFFHTTQMGDVLSRFTLDVIRLRAAVGSHFVQLVQTILIITAAFISLLFIDAMLTLLCCAIIPATLVVGRILGRRIKRRTTQVQETVGRSVAYLQDTLYGMETVKIFGLGCARARRFSDLCRDSLRKSLLLSRTNAALVGSSDALESLGFLVAFAGAGYLVLEDSITVGELIAFVQLLNWITSGFSRMTTLWGEFMAAVACGERVFAVLDTPSESAGRRGAFAPLRVGAGLAAGVAVPAVSFEHVTFAYDEETPPVLQDVCLTLMPGQNLVLLGDNGAGKTTLIRLLCGFLAPSEGDIYVSGCNIREVDPEQLRAHISVVTQNAHLFDATIGQNIGDGRTGATAADIRDAARLATADEFIAGRTGGLDAPVGERGALLSGGERQKVAIARALLKGAGIVILDEGMSQLDSRSQASIIDALFRRGSDKNTIVISHDIAVAQRADVVAVIDEGRLIATDLV